MNRYMNDGKRSLLVRFRLNEDEMATLRGNAEMAGMSMSAYFRRVAIEAKPAPKNVVDMSVLRKALFELQRQGNNLNQIARKANSTRSFPKPLLDEIGEAVHSQRIACEEIYWAVCDIREEAIKL